MNYHATIRESGDKWFGISVPFTRGFSETLRSRVPVAAWEGSTKTWWLPERYLSAAREVVKAFFPDIPIGEQRRIEHRHHQSPLAEAYDVLGVDEEAAPSVIGAAAKTLLREFSESIEHCERIRWAERYITEARAL